MSFFMSDALAAVPAAGPHAAQGSGMSTLIFLLVFFLIFYMLFIRPQSKRAKQHRDLISNLAMGDEVVTSGGLIGTIVSIQDNIIEIEVADGVKVKMQKPAIAASLPKGSINSA